MRGRALVLVAVIGTLPLTGCLTDDGGTLPDGRGSVTGGTGSDAPAACPVLDVRTDPASGFRPGDALRVQVALVNCSNETLTPVLPFCPKEGVLEIRVTVDGETWYLGNGPSLSRDVPDHDCEAFEREIPPGDAFGPDVGWNGRFATADCTAMRCGDDAWAAPGEYVVHATLVAGNGTTWTASETVTFLPPVVPPFTDDGEVTLLLEDAYAAGDTARVRVRNDGARTFTFSEYYPACRNLQFFNETGYPFIVPEGTHCDIANEDTLEPGETVTLFEWDLDECVVDRWGCAESRPLPPGTYHVAAEFDEDVERAWEKPDAVTRTGATFRVT